MLFSAPAKLASAAWATVARSGALPEVIGPCGPVFERDDAASLAAVLSDMIRHPNKVAAYRAAIPAHLEQYSHRAQIDASEALIADAMKRA